MKIMVAIPFSEEQEKRLRQAAPEAEFVFTNARGITEELASSVDIILGNTDPEYFVNSKKLKWVQLSSAGADIYCKPGIMKEGQLLTNSSSAYNISVGENMVAFTLAMMKKLYSYYDNQKENKWMQLGSVMSAKSATVLILGLGEIGLYYARIMKAMGSHIIGIKKNTNVEIEGIDEICSIDELEECLGRADIVCNVLPGTKETYKILNEKSFKAMKNSAYLLNVGRGNAVDLEALCDALDDGEIAGALLDVTDPEPLPKEHRAWSTQGLYITPHIAGFFYIPETKDLVTDIFCENLRRYQAGEELIHLVDVKKGY